MLPKHHAVQLLLESDLFDDISRFSQLEARIAALPTTKERGDAFEVFAEAYLATQANVQAKEVWPHESVPIDIRQRLSLPSKDMGVDGVLQTHLGHFNAYQVKFRTGRSALTWDELSTFMGLADQVRQRVLLTNSDDFPALMNDRQGFFCIRGSDLDRLEPGDFQSIVEWLERGVFTKTPKNPRAHQDEALAAILSALEREDRVTSVMACGTGKTLVALWAAERSQPKTVLVLLPSLALVRQALHEWLKETRWAPEELVYLCVCSDPTVTKDVDGIVVRQSDLDFPVSTNSQDVRQFLAQSFAGVRVVFSTYQSVHLVADALTGQPPIDFAIFDEAHKTASWEGTRFAFALKDSNLPIRKRLFLTATPRHYDVRVKDKEGDARLVYSMDVPEVYGTVAHTLPFAEAARRGIICGYKVIISVITSDMVNQDLLRRGEVVVDGDLVKAGHVAGQIALQEAVEKYGVKKVITFHRSVAAAQSFTTEGGEGIRVHLPDFASHHVSGAMSTAQREQRMRAFSAAERAIISNARCLTEGVDVPAVDMVAFMSPRRSRVDIVQATGRAMRKVPDKTTGYVLVPLFLDLTNGESIEEALERTGFDEVWLVLQALQEQDQVLATAIHQMREDKGRIGGYNDYLFRERVEILGPSISLETLRTAITAACVDRLGVTWDERYGELKAYKERFGDCRVPYKWSENPQLGTWVVVQRQVTKLGQTGKDRTERLNEIGFVWDPHDAYWEEMFAALVNFKEANGHCNVPIFQPDNRALGQWVNRHRNNRKRGEISEERLRRMNAIGFVWDALESSWEEMFAELLEYKATHGDCDVPKIWPQNQALATWIGSQRQFCKNGTLSDERISRLDAIGVVWHTKKASWEKMFAALVKYKKLHGDCNVPQGDPDNPQLGSWVDSQRKHRKQEALTQERIQQLDALGFTWDMRAASWEELFSALVEYKKAHGDCNVPYDWQDNPRLGTWVVMQRQAKKGKKRNSLNGERIRRLDGLGFIWDPRDICWEEMFAALIAYKAKHGDCAVPKVWPENQPLAGWVFTQRRTMKQGSLGNDRVRRLNEIAFIWDTLDDYWERMFAALVAFKAVHGHCNVPRGWLENPALARWINRHRNEKKQGTLTKDHISRLDTLGFVWDLRGQSSATQKAL